jgi:predicted metal-binding protein
MRERIQGFSDYQETSLIGVFTLPEDEDQAVELAKILKAKGAEVIHMATCAFSHKAEGKTWLLGQGFYSKTDDVAGRIAAEAGIPCVKGTAHLPEGYQPEVFR